MSQLLSTLSDHTNNIMSMELVEPLQLISCSLDKTIKVWDYLTGKCLKTLTHTASVTCIHIHPLDKTRLVSGYSDNTIKVWGF